MNSDFFNELKDRFKMPWKHFAFKSYFFWILLMFGSLGIFITIYDVVNSKAPDCNLISQSISTTFIALIAGSLVDLNLSFTIKNIPSLIINTIATVGVSILFLFLSFKIDGALSLLPAIVGYILAILIWIIANADNEKLSDETFYKKILKKAQELTNDWD